MEPESWKVQKRAKLKKKKQSSLINFGVREDVWQGASLTDNKIKKLKKQRSVKSQQSHSYLHEKVKGSCPLGKGWPGSGLVQLKPYRTELLQTYLLRSI